MELSSKILSDIVVYSKYAQHKKDEFRREVWQEIVTRNMEMHMNKYPKLADEIQRAYRLVYDRKILPSMRALQFSGRAIEISPNRQYNCSFVAIDDWNVFHEIMFLLLGGSGVGYSVQKHHVEKLPRIQRPIERSRRHLIADSIEGWADAVKILMKSYFFGLSDPMFDFSIIRPKGSPLKTSGGRAPGPQPLKDALHNIRKILDTKPAGSKLTPLEVHDIICFISDAVLSGGIRRAALIALFSMDDIEMLTCKYPASLDKNPQRKNANNSAVLLRHRIKKSDFLELWKIIEKSGCGEPGLYFSNNMEWGANPCVEIAMRSTSFCNLTTGNVSNVISQADFNERMSSASLIGTLQAGYTDFHYLRDEWREVTEKEALLGVSLTGVSSGAIDGLNTVEAAKVVVEENKRIAKLIGINPAARTTCIKPEGTSSLVVGTSSGIHAWYNDYYIRRMVLNKQEPIYDYLKTVLPELVEDSFYKPHLEGVLSIPIKAPAGSKLRHESPLELLARIKKYHDEWIVPGHISGDNTHNISATIPLKDDEWDAVGEWMWENKDSYNGLTVFPECSSAFQQMPHEDCTKEVYEKMCESLKKIDLTEVLEYSDNTNLLDQAACAGGACSVDKVGK